MGGVGIVVSDAAKRPCRIHFTTRVARSGRSQVGNRLDACREVEGGCYVKATGVGRWVGIVTKLHGDRGRTPSAERELVAIRHAARKDYRVICDDVVR